MIFNTYQKNIGFVVMAAASPQSIANSLIKKIVDFDNTKLSADFDRLNIKRDIDSLKKAEPYKAYIIEGIYYTVCEKNKEKALYSVENGLRLNSHDHQSLANAGSVYRNWGDMDKSCNLYVKAFCIGRDVQYIITAINQAFISGLMKDVYEKLEFEISNIKNENILSHIKSMYDIYKSIDQKDILYFKDKIISVLSEFNKDMDAIRVVRLDESKVFVNISIANTSVDELFKMNDRFFDLVSESLLESPASLTLNYTFTYPKESVSNSDMEI